MIMFRRKSHRLDLSRYYWSLGDDGEEVDEIDIGDIIIVFDESCLSFSRERFIPCLSRVGIADVGFHNMDYFETFWQRID